MNICIFGDSITWGGGDNQKGGWVERLKIFYQSSRDDVHVYNLGICGEKTSDLLKRFEHEAVARKSDLILIAIGINDSQYLQTKDYYRTNLDDFKKNISELAGIAQKMAVKVVFIGLTRADESKTMPLPWSAKTFYDNESIELYDMALKNFCDENSLKYVSLKEIVDLTDLEDGLHPNAKGHEKIFKKIGDSIEPYEAHS